MLQWHPDLPIAGSPQRAAWRSVVAAVDGRRFVLERISSRAYGRKRRIAETLQRLADDGLSQVVTYLPAADGDFLPLIDHAVWQMAPYVEGLALDRPAYTLDGWRGTAAADFLMSLKAAGNHRADTSPVRCFSIATYTRQLFDTLADVAPPVATRFRPFLEHLEARLFPFHDDLPMGFCHGDFHPLNIVWGNTTIRGVIDWEFCGVKPEIYDLANLLGCLGIEDPAGLAGPLAIRLVERLKLAGIYSDRSWQALPDLLLAIRFAWLGEWLRNDDRPMIRMEADYMAWIARERITFPAGE
jgi:homoserine kinase type II